MKLLTFVLCLALLAGCKKPDHSQPGVQTAPITSRDDSLFLADDWLELGWDQYSYEDFDSGLVLFDSALKYNPELSQAWHGRALMLHNLNRYDEAEPAYRNAEKYDSLNKQAIWHCGCMYSRWGKKEQALRQLRTVVALDARYAETAQWEECWVNMRSETGFLEIVGALDKE